MKMLDAQAAYFFDLETSLHKNHIRKSAKASALLTDEFVEFGSSGKIWDKPGILASMRSERLGRPITVEGFVARVLAPDVVLVTYISKRQEVGLDKQSTVMTLRSSIWKRFGGGWQMVFHQGTRTSEAPEKLHQNTEALG